MTSDGRLREVLEEITVAAAHTHHESRRADVERWLGLGLGLGIGLGIGLGLGLERMLGAGQGERCAGVCSRANPVVSHPVVRDLCDPVCLSGVGWWLWDPVCESGV